MSDAAIQSDGNASAERDEKGRWLTPPKSPGRPKGSRNKFAEEFLSDFLADWQENGAAAIVAMRRESPKDYVKIGAAILPKQVDVTVSDLEKLPDDELIQRIAELESRANAFINRIGEAEGREGAPAEHAQTAVLPALH